MNEVTIMYCDDYHFEPHVSPLSEDASLTDANIMTRMIFFVNLVTTGFISSAAERMGILVGYEKETAVWMFTSAALICAIFSYFWGWGDVKIGTSKKSIAYAFFFAITHAFLLIRGNEVFTYITLLLVGASIAGIK